MALDPVAAFMLGIIVGQWLSILMLLKVVKAVLDRPSTVSADALELSEQVALIAQLIGRELPESTKPRGSVVQRAPLPAKKKSRHAAT